MFYVYVIKSESSGKIYIGQSNDLDLRFKRHNGKLPAKSGSYTKINKGPWKLVYKEEYATREDAVIREKYLKSHRGRDWLKLMKVR
ncbi:GIY-YIG nuclease family protein [Candidatus Daviesbacteria bacterium]|nr:GIY-YIG nuclease family protein [Candidatus Daviesbacteria bacterium]